jgi:hypothetical protein
MVTLEQALETAMNLPPTELDDFISILTKRRSQEWRKDTAFYHKELKKDIKDGKLKSQDAEKAIEELHNYLESENDVS